MSEMMTMNEYYHWFLFVVVLVNLDESLFVFFFVCGNIFNLPTSDGCNNWPKLIVSEEETCAWRPVEFSDEFKRKFSKPGGGPNDFCWFEQTRSFICWIKTSSNVFECSSVFSFVIDGVVETIDETKRAARSASVKL